jgi:hypothetical protein
MMATTLLRALPVKLTIQPPTLPPSERTAWPRVWKPSSIQPRAISGTFSAYQSRMPGVLAWASSHRSDRLPRIWAVCSTTGCASRRSRNATSNNEPRKTITAAMGRRIVSQIPPCGSVCSTRRTSGSSM